MVNVKNCINSDKIFPIIIDFPEEIKKEIKKYALSDTTKELGGVLVGTVSESEINNYKISVVDFIIAKHTDAHLSSVTFTAESWAEINAEMDEKYPDCKIIGWFHTHPGFGIFLSSWDIFIQEHFFNLPWQIAYVVDPCHKTDGIFIWEENQILKISEDSFVNETIDKNNNKSKKNFFNKIQPKLKIWIYIAVIIILTVLIFLFSENIIYFIKFIIAYLKHIFILPFKF